MVTRLALPQRFEQASTVVDNAGYSSWSTVGGSAAGSNTTLSGACPDGNDALRITIDDASSLRRIGSGTITAATYVGPFGVWLRHNGAPNIDFRFIAWRETFSGSGYYQYNLDISTSNTAAAAIGNEWWFHTFGENQLSAQGGAPAWGNGQSIDHYYLGFQTDGSGAGASADLGTFYAGLRSFPVCIISFDDSNVTDITEGYQYLLDQSYDTEVKCTTYTIPENINTANFLTEANLDTLKTAGWDIAGHHADDLSALSYANQLTRIEETKDWLKARGYDWEHFSYPLGRFNSDTKLALRTAGIKTARTTSNAPQDTSIDTDYFYGNGYGSSQSNQAAHKAQLDEAILYGGTFEYYTHRLENSSPGPTHTLDTEWQGFVDYAVQKQREGKLKILTKSQWYQMCMGYRI